MLKIKQLKVNTDNKEILKGINLTINKNEVHVLMGPNGSGKSTLAQTLMGHPNYHVTDGEIIFEDKNLLELKSNERALSGLFLSFQYPSEVTGVSITNFLRTIYNKKNAVKLSPIKFREILQEKMSILGISQDFTSRYLNEGFSGGEKKKMEMLQMLIMEPKLAILDELDSGLDIDALKTVSEAVNYLRTTTNMSVLVITHYTRILNYIIPDFVHVIKDGVLVKSGGKELADELEQQGYAPFGE
ncbi:Fe-S cluster assembly ATPase SufC [candidate division WWE3 bacterium]|nr:Fe-S cluster assembly ATPase SufC [candidate division WWE3 bacterium]